ncbi:MAG: hydroxyethylthiazole kinase [Desulfarculus sp.]|nr:hydroxyethylthiazole kinase [Pseudomonadota bacterium]MBV1714289.1 hydroxyethylthiazole kinase [Desulfarculus sp.]MBU4576449.1 hydroxyethylthiazole kinase [Pseudomonadota bacterium]MBU4596960.1 hydroxyethylthiazole kinase [Pseudomonadota bacterium]MBV1737655.1 hydroxyethylthiazole kinase [Desulfarculus sp.]
METLAQKAAECLARVRENQPLVHNITNFVVMNSTANALLACGASPVMAHAIEEVEQMVSFAGALVLNIGTLTPPWIESMLLAAKKARILGVPAVLDPVGSGATEFRTNSSRRIISEAGVSLVRGNASEVLSLSDRAGQTKGVDSTHSVDETAQAGRELALAIATPVAITGAVDLITDGKRTLRVANGHALMTKVTGTGCLATAIIGAFLAVEPDTLEATAAALAYVGLAGEKAAAISSGPGSLQVNLLDALYNISPADLAQGARIIA